MIIWLAAALFLFSVCLVLAERNRIKKMMHRMEVMLDAAKKGNFAEQNFDEEQLSRLESSMAHYLADNELTLRNLKSDKDKISTMISDISHQTKTPISNLLLYSELLREETLPQSANESVAQIHAQAQKLSFLISSLVKLSRLETGIVTVNPTVRPVINMLHALYGQYEPAAKEKGLKLIVHESEAWAVFDEKWTLEAVGNIVDNAIKYTDSGMITVSVESYEMFTCIQVSDTGQGIKEAETAKIFGRFYRSPDVRDEKGVGIGLFLARQIIMSQKGYIKVTSKTGQGSRFSVYLPAAQPNLSKL